MANHTVMQLQATGIYSDGSTRNVTSLAAWSSTSTDTAVVGAGGRINSGNAGVATISACFGGHTATAKATVTSAQLKSITVAPGTHTLPSQASQRYTATGTFSDGTSQDVSLLVHWMTSSLSSATILNSVQLKGMANTLTSGTVNITASFWPSVSGTASLTVKPATLVSIAVTPANRTVAAGNAIQFTATGTFSDQTIQNLTSGVSWSSSNPSALFVSNEMGSPGFGYGLTQGQSTVTATFGSLTGTTSFSVTAPNLISISVSPQSSTVIAGNTQQFTATGTFADGSTQNITASTTWSSSSPAATVGDSPGTDGLALGVSSGQAAITASSSGVSGSGQLTVSSAQLMSISVTPANPEISVGDSQQFTATGTYTDGNTQDLTSTVNWTSN